MVFIKVLVYLSMCNLHYEFAKSQERKQTSFSGLRKSAEPLAASVLRQRHNKQTSDINRKSKPF